MAVSNPPTFGTATNPAAGSIRKEFETLGSSTSFYAYRRGGGIIPDTTPFSGVGLGTSGSPLRMSQFAGLTAISQATITVGTYNDTSNQGKVQNNNWYYGYNSGAVSGIWGPFALGSISGTVWSPTSVVSSYFFEGTYGQDYFILNLAGDYTHLSGLTFYVGGAPVAGGSTGIPISYTDYEPGDVIIFDSNTAVYPEYSTWAWDATGMTNPYGSTAGVTKTAYLTATTGTPTPSLFTPYKGSYSSANRQQIAISKTNTTASLTLTCSTNATWSYTVESTYNNSGTVSRASGTTGTSITFEVPYIGAVYNYHRWYLEATAGGVTRHWYLPFASGPN